MKVVALISGGKDSCYNMIQCVAEGHKIVALANLQPQLKDELDSYMYQTVGHHAIDLYADAMQLPLYRRKITGSPLQLDADYRQTQHDEVEDLFELLQEVKEAEKIEAVAVGAILSDYQRVRVENVCGRLGLMVLAYLWRRDQKELLSEMIECQIEAIIIKVAALGLTPNHLGKTIAEIYPHMLKMEEQYGLNVCGEGGEYETFTLDCPLFTKAIRIQETETILHSNDAFAPVAYLNLKSASLVDKQVQSNSGDQVDRIADLNMKRSCDLKKELFGEETDFIATEVSTAEQTKKLASVCYKCTRESIALSRNEPRRTWTCRVVAERIEGEPVEASVRSAMDRLLGLLRAEENISASNLISIGLYISRMSDFNAINSIYKSYFSINPPVRACVEVSLPEDVLFLLDATGVDEEIGRNRKTMHVQGISHWAPANIGPYSQAIMVDNLIHVAGQIALSPATMTLVEGGAVVESCLSLRHVSRILEAMHHGVTLRHVALAVCYVTHVNVIPVAESAWKKALSCDDVDTSSAMSSPLVLYVVVSALPRNACVEWHVIASVELESWQDRRKSFNKTDMTVDVRWRQSEEVQHVLPLVITVFSTNPDVVTLSSSMSEVVAALSDMLKSSSIDVHSLGSPRIFCRADLYSCDDVHDAYRLQFDQTFDRKDGDRVDAMTVPVQFRSDDCLFCLAYL